MFCNQIRMTRTKEENSAIQAKVWVADFFVLLPQIIRSMRQLLYILILLVSACFSPNVRSDSTQQNASTISQSTSEKISYNDLPNKELSLTSAQSVLGMSEETGISLNVRNHPSGSRTQSSVKNPLRIIKDGKTIDIRQFPSLRDLPCGLSGALSVERYLYTIRRIRI